MLISLTRSDPMELLWGHRAVRLHESGDAAGSYRCRWANFFMSTGKSRSGIATDLLEKPE